MGMNPDDPWAVFGGGVWIWRRFWNDIVVMVAQFGGYNKIDQLLCLT